MYIIADNFCISLYRLPAYITELKNIIDALKKEIDQIDAKKQKALKDCHMTLDYAEYNANKPFVLRLQKYKQQLVEKEQQLVEELEKRRKLEKELQCKFVERT